MQTIEENKLFTFYTNDSNDESILESMAILFRSIWIDVDYPYETQPLNFFKRRLKQQMRKDQISKIIMIVNENKIPLGIVNLNINIGKTNRDNCNANFYIKKEFRRNGYFKALFFESLKYIPEEVKIMKFFFRIDDNQKDPHSPKSLQSKIEGLKDQIGAKLAFTGRRSESDLTQFNLETVKSKASELRKKAFENGYDIYFVSDIEFSDVPFTRQEYVQLIEEISNDMPRDESVQDDSEFTEFDYLNWYKFANEDKMTFWNCIAVDRKTRKPIGMTETKFWDYQPSVAYVGDTGVQRDHRGKKLGLTLKYLILEKLLSETKVKHWVTFNAKSNAHMIAINDLLGYKQNSHEVSYEIPVQKLKEYFLKN